MATKGKFASNKGFRKAVVLISIIIIVVLLYVILSSVYTTAPLSFYTSCTSISGYECANVFVNTTGQISFTFGQATGNTLYNVRLSCISGAASFLPPLPAANTSYAVLNNSVVQVRNLICYSENGSPVGAQKLGAPFNASIWVNYTSTSAAQNFSVQRVASVHASVG